jgi:tetratricopeptide (TPR) repeat protein
MRLPITLLVVTTSLLASAARAADPAPPLDCAQCRAVCGKPRAYPEDARPESPSAVLKHKSPEAEKAFNDGKASDPAFGGKDARVAITAYKRAVILDGDSSHYRNHLAGALMTAGLLDEAIYNLEAAARLVPSEPKYLTNLGYAHHRAGDETRALIYYMRALALDSRDVRARLYAGYALELLGYTTEATLEMKKVLAQDPANPEARRALGRLGVRIDEPPAPLTQTK